MQVEDLGKRWRALILAGPLRDMPVFEAGGLVLGAQTVLLKAADEARDPDDDDRLVALLRLAYARPFSEAQLRHVKAAAGRWRAGDGGQAALHLALASLGRLPDPEPAARRLFLVDEAMAAGVSPRIFLAAPDAEAIRDTSWRKYSPDQPRVPAGSGRPSGRWRSAGANAPSAKTRRPAALHAGSTPPKRNQLPAPAPAPATSAVAAAHPAAPTKQRTAQAQSTPRPRLPDVRLSTAPLAPAELGLGVDLGALSAAALRGLLVLWEAGLTVGSALATPVILGFGLALAPNPGPRGRWVRVGGPNDISFRRNLDEMTIRFKYKDAGGKEQIYDAPPGPDGNYRGPDGRVIARWVKAGARLALAIKLAAFAAEQKAQNENEPKRCPLPGPDHPGARPKDRDYEDQMKRIVNPLAPTPRGVGYTLFTPDGDPVVFEDCQHQTGWMFEAKGTGYAEHLVKNDIVGQNMSSQMVDQAERQTLAGQGRMIVWVFAEKPAVDVMRHVFNGIGGDVANIKILTLPRHKSMR